MTTAAAFVALDDSPPREKVGEQRQPHYRRKELADFYFSPMENGYQTVCVCVCSFICYALVTKTKILHLRAKGGHFCKVGPFLILTT